MVKKTTKSVKKAAKKAPKKVVKKAPEKAASMPNPKEPKGAPVNTAVADDEVRGTFARFTQVDDEEQAWIKPENGGLDWMMSAEAAKKLGLKKGDAVIGKMAFPSSSSRRILKSVRRR